MSFAIDSYHHSIRKQTSWLNPEKGTLETRKGICTIKFCLRKLQDLTVKIIEEMPIVYDIQTDYLFLKGIEKGHEKGMVQGLEKGIEESKLLFIKSLLSNTDFSDEKIAQLVGCKLETVQQVRNNSNVVLPKLKKVVKKRVRQKPKDIN